MRTVVILGAGISRAASGNVSLTYRPPLDADFFQIARACYKKRHDEILATLNNLLGDYAHTLTSSLEVSAAYLYLKAIDSPTGSDYHKGFLNLLNLLNAVLGKTTNNLSLGPRSLLYRFLLAEIRKLDSPKNLSIITFNYDLLAERTLDEIAKKNGAEIFSFPGCYRFNDISQIHKIKIKSPLQILAKNTME